MSWRNLPQTFNRYKAVILSTIELEDKQMQTKLKLTSQQVLLPALRGGCKLPSLPATRKVSSASGASARVHSRSEKDKQYVWMIFSYRYTFKLAGYTCYGISKILHCINFGTKSITI